jgi:homoserine kinase type II
MPKTTQLDKTTLSLLQDVADFFQLESPTSIDLFPEGLGNLNYLVKTNNGDFVIKDSLFHPLEDTKLEMIYLERLLAHNFPAPSYLPGINGEKIFQKSGHIFLAQKKFEGKHPEPNPDVCAELGKWLAKLHKIPFEGLPSKNHWMSPAFITKHMDVLQKSHLPYKDQALASYEKLRKLDFDSLPQAIIHNDVYRDNLLFDGVNLVGMIDWEEATVWAAILDIATPVVDLCLHEGQVIEQNYKALLNGYSAERKLQEAELNSLRNAVQYVSFINSAWMMVQFGIETPDQEQLSKSENYWRFDLDNLVLPKI